MPVTKRTAEEARPVRQRCPLSERISEIETLVIPEVHQILAASWDGIDSDDVNAGVSEYLDVLVRAIERDSVDPIDQYIRSLDSLWEAEQFAIDPIIECIFKIGDVTKAFVCPEDDESVAPSIEQMTRYTVELITRRSVNIVTTRLFEQVEKHRAGEERLMSLHRVAAVLGSDLDLERALTMVVEEARALIGADGVGIRLANDQEELEFITGIGDDLQILRPYSLSMHDSLSGAVFLSRTSLRVADVENDARVSQHFRQSDGRSLLIVPLIMRDRPIGIIGGSSTRVGAFSEEDELLLELFADQAANAIENARLYEQATSQIAELAMLHRVSQVVSSSLELDQIFQTLHEEVERIMPAHSFLVALARADNLYDVEFIIDNGQRYPPRRGIELSPFLGDGIDRGEIVVHQDVTSQPSYSQAHRFGDPARQVRSLIAAPLIRGNRVIGMVSSQSYELHDYREPESRMLRTIANQAAVAIEHARLFRQAQNVAVAEERARLAREIHDTLAQGLIGIILCLERIDLSLPEHDELHRPWVERALELSRSNLDEARRSVRDLRAAPLEGRTLLEAVANLIVSTEDDVEFEIAATLPPSLPPLSARVETALFRVIQESISNTRKHATCSRLDVRLVATGPTLALSIRDDGVGFDYSTELHPDEHYGITTMRERVQQIGGTLEIESCNGHGTEVRVSLPMQLAIHQESTDSRRSDHSGRSSRH